MTWDYECYIYIFIYLIIFKFLFIDMREREEQRDRGRETLFSKSSIIYALISCFLTMPWLGTKPRTLVHQDNAPTELPSKANFSTFLSLQKEILNP